jgi:hypothetical protein
MGVWQNTNKEHFFRADIEGIFKKERENHVFFQPGCSKVYFFEKNGETEPG